MVFGARRFAGLFSTTHLNNTTITTHLSSRLGSIESRQGVRCAVDNL